VGFDFVSVFVADIAGLVLVVALVFVVCAEAAKEIVMSIITLKSNFFMTYYFYTTKRKYKADALFMLTAN